MQINKFIILLLFLLPFSVYASAGFQTIDNKSALILKGTFSPLEIIKVKIYNENTPQNLYFSFIKTDLDGVYTLTNQDINLSKIKDGNIIFEIMSNNENNPTLITTKTLILDKGLLLNIHLHSANKTQENPIINSYEMYNFILEGETEHNLKDLTITISDSNNNTLTYEYNDIFLNNNAFFTISNIDLSSLEDGNITVIAKGIDIAGNKTTKTLQLLKDSVVIKPLVLKIIKNNNLSNVVNKNILIASGTAEPLSIIKFTFTQGHVIVQESVFADENGKWELVGGDLDVSVFKNKDVKVSVLQQDVAKNISKKYTYVNKKFKRPIFPITPLPIDPIKYQLIYTIDGHDDAIRDIFITKTKLYTATYGYVKIWGKAYAKLKAEIEIPNTWANAIIVTDDKIFVALSTGKINVYNKYNRKRIKVLQADTLPITNLKLYKDTLVSSSASGAIKLWNINSYTNTATLKKHQWDVGAIAIHDNFLFSGSDDYAINKFDLSTNKLVKKLKSAHRGTINDILIYKDMLISASDDKRIIIRNLKTGDIVKVLLGHKKSVKKLSIVNNFLISVSNDRTMIFWNLSTGKIIKKIKAHSKKITSLAVNDFNIVTGSRDNKIKIWGYDDSIEALDSEDETNQAKYSLLKSFYIKEGTPTALTQNENDIVVATNNGHIYFYHKVTYDYTKEYSTLDTIVKPLIIKRKQSLEEFEAEQEDVEDEEKEDEIVPTLQSIHALVNYGNQLLAALDDSTIKVWDLQTDKAVSLLTGLDSSALDISISSLNILSASKRGTIAIYDIETNDFINLIEGHQYNVNTLAMYEDDKVISAGNDYSIKIRDIESGDTILDIKNAHDNIITKVVVHNNLLISSSLDGTIKIREITTGKLIKVLNTNSNGVLSLVVDDENIIAGLKNSKIMVWNLQNYQHIATMDKHYDAVVGIMITDDYIISISKDKTIKVWKYYE